MRMWVEEIRETAVGHNWKSNKFGIFRFQIYPIHRITCHQCSGDLNSNCSNTENGNPKACRTYMAGDRCYIRKTSKQNHSNSNAQTNNSWSFFPSFSNEIRGECWTRLFIGNESLPGCQIVFLLRRTWLQFHQCKQLRNTIVIGCNCHTIHLHCVGGGIHCIQNLQLTDSTRSSVSFFVLLENAFSLETETIQTIRYWIRLGFWTAKNKNIDDTEIVSE